MMQLKMDKFRVRVAVVLLVSLLVMIVGIQQVQAHSRAVVGDYIFVLGWESEPPLVGERNSIFLEIERESTGEAISGAEATLVAVVTYAGETLRVNLVPVESTPGRYHVDLIPTVRGTFSLELTGNVEETEIDLLLDADEVFPPLQLQFPETAPDILSLQADLEEQIESLQTELQTARLLAIGAILLAVVSTVIGVVAWRKSSPSGE